MMRGFHTIRIPIFGGQDITIEGEWPISEADWEQFTIVLNAMKPGLVRDDTERSGTWAQDVNDGKPAVLRGPVIDVRQPD